MTSKILFADDDISINEDDRITLRLKYALAEQHPNITLRCARDAAATHKALKEEVFIGIILDIMMPHGIGAPIFISKEPEYRTGLAIAEALSKKKYDFNQTQKVVMLSGTALPEVCSEVAGIVNKFPERFVYLEKPMDMAEVLVHLGIIC